MQNCNEQKHFKQRNAPNGKCNSLCSSLLVVPIPSILMQVLQFQLMMMVVFCDRRERCMNCSCEGLGILQMATFITPIKWESHHPLNSCQAGSKVRPTGLTKNSFFSATSTNSKLIWKRRLTIHEAGLQCTLDPAEEFNQFY